MDNTGNWITEWVTIYPEDAMFNDRKLRSQPEDCVKKMQKFCKDNPQYTKDIIFAATKQYIEEKERKNFEYTKQATYFISKQGEPSLLKEYCQRVLIGKVEVKQPIVYNYEAYDMFI